MSHERLWAPWRMAYIQGTDAPPSQATDAPPSQAADPASLKLLPGADAGCFLCRDVVDTADQTNLVVHRGPRTIVVLNRYPYNNGHLLVAPHVHRGRLDELDADTHAEMQTMIARLVMVLERIVRAEGFNVGLNLGRVAGAGVPGHLHWHIVPRWSGDTNFMPVLGDARVISQSLEALWELLVPEFATASKPVS